MRSSHCPQLDENESVRSPSTILALGLGACLALGLMMQHLVRVSKERNDSPVLREINRVYRSRLDGDAMMRLLQRPDGTVAELTITPLMAGRNRELAREIGHFVWRATQDRPLLGVEVVCDDPLGSSPQRFVVDRPFLPEPSAPPRSPAAKPAPGPTPSPPPVPR